MRSMQAISSGVVDEVWLAARIPVCSYCCTAVLCCCEPEFDLAQLESSRLAEHARHPGAVASRLASKWRRRAARAEAGRAGRWWVELDSNLIFFFVRVMIGVPVEFITSAVRVAGTVHGNQCIYHVWFHVGVVSSSYEKNEVFTLFSPVQGNPFV